MFGRKAPAQFCPICGARYPLTVRRCTRCGATLHGIRAPGAETTTPVARAKRTTRIDAPVRSTWEPGEADLHEGALPKGPLYILFFGALAVLVVGLVGALVMVVQGQAASLLAAATPVTTNSAAVAASAEIVTPVPGTTLLAPPPTNTRVFVFATLAVSTVTPQPPTATITPTVGPCIQRATQGDTVYGMAARCGHRDMAVVDLVLRLNGLSSANQLQINQELQIPWPTVPGEAEDTGFPVGTLEGDGSAMIEATLPPGVMWYTVQSGDTPLGIMYQRGINMRILRDLNPDMDFDGCDFGMEGGGPSCTVMIFEGQRLRVPAPTPTATLPPTLTGSETPAPTPTPLVNVPFSVSPSENMLFEGFEFPTLRWVASGTLAADEIYLLNVEDRTGGMTYIIPTRELSFQLPPEWLPTDGARHTFYWSVAVARLQTGTNTAVPTERVTETRSFTWISR